MILREFLGEELLHHFIWYPNMKNKYPIQVIDMIFQVEQITLKKIQVLEEYKGNSRNARSFVLLIRLREKEMISDGNKLIEIIREVI